MYLHNKLFVFITGNIILMLSSIAFGQGSGFGGYIPPESGQTGLTSETNEPTGAPAQTGMTTYSRGGNTASQQEGGYIPTATPNAPAPGAAANAQEKKTNPEEDKILPPPFELTPDEQKKLDEFLIHWEKFGKDIKRVACDVHVREFDGGVFHQNSNTPIAHTWGQFRFIAPNKLMYHVLGEFVYFAATNGAEPKPEWKASSNETKILYDGKSFVQYDYKKKVATIYPIPEENRNQDLTMDGPFPIFFIAKAEKLKEKFYLRIVTPENLIQRDVWIEAFPRFARDAQNYKSLVILMRLTDLQPYFLRKMNTNGKSRSDLEFQNVSINRGIWNIEPTFELGWTKKVENP